MFNCLCADFAVSVQRLNRSLYFGPRTGFKRLLAVLLLPVIRILQFFCVVSCKIFFQDETVLGSGVRLSNRGRDIVGAREIGDGCVIHHDVTLGMSLSDREEPGTPIIAKNVWIGPNTLIYGDVRIGEGVTVLGGTVLTKSLPDRCVIAGNPPRIILRDFDNTPLLKSKRFDFDADAVRELAGSDA